MTTPASSPAAAAGSRPPRRSFKSYLWGSLAGAVLLIALYTWLMLSWSYSDGERAGVLQKFSKRGWVCKTWEGELAMYVVGGVAPQIWNFSVRDDAVAEQLHAAVGQQVRLHYSEHPGLPTNCFGETDYFVQSVEIVGAPPWMGAAPPVAPTSPVPPAAQAPSTNP